MRNFRYYFPPLHKILNSWRIRSREFLRENTLHGFPYFVNHRRPLWERIIWLLLTIASMASAIGIMITIYQRFQLEPTLSGLDTKTEELVTHFPSITLCNLKPDFKFGDYETDSEYYNWMYKWTQETAKNKEQPTKSLVDETYSQFFMRVSPECDKVYENCTVDSYSTSCKKLFTKTLVNRGICCVINAVEITYDNGRRKVEFDTAAYPISIDLLGVLETPVHRHTSVGFVIKTGTEVKISIEITYPTEGLKSLPKNQRKCLTPDEADSYSSCIYNCKREYFLETCNCLPWYMMIKEGDKECLKAEEYDCLSQNETSHGASKCSCYLSCNHTTYHFESVTLAEKNHIGIALSNWPRVSFKHDIRYGWLDLLVSFGGIAGLFVGYSLLTTVELAYYLSLRAYCGAVLDESEKTIKVKAKTTKRSQRKVENVSKIPKQYFNYID